MRTMQLCAQFTTRVAELHACAQRGDTASVITPRLAPALSQDVARADAGAGESPLGPALMKTKHLKAEDEKSL